ncbi:MAG: LLM class flavin-dependent oxidoreductase [Gammaproteobacteria bacterium]|nr:LLM class flavin-dependent oxidoreductase [Gammaproteobacteria bacterium]
MAVGVGLGLMEFPFSGASAFWKWVDLCEQGGIDSLWQTDRLVSKMPMLECMSAMAALAGATKKIKFGMNVASAGLRDPLLLAKQCATIDMLSEGRLLPAFGIGSALGPDWVSMGRPTKGRGRLTDEALEIISRLWSGERLTYEGEFFQYKKAIISPLPAQSQLPLWIGGSSKAAIRRTARVGTGWLAGREAASDVGAVVDGIKAACLEEGRTIDDDHYGAGFFYRFGTWDEPIIDKRVELMKKTMANDGRDPKEMLAVGSVEDIMAHIERFVDGGVSKFILRPIGVDDDDLYNQTRRLIEEVIPAVDALNSRRDAKADAAD